jgi:hypothetical protein
LIRITASSMKNGFSMNSSTNGLEPAKGPEMSARDAIITTET